MLSIDSSNSFFLRSLSFFGKKPVNMKVFIGIFDTDNAQLSDDAPGIGMIFISGRSFDNKWYPGSDIDGVPASVTKAILLDLSR